MKRASHSAILFALLLVGVGGCKKKQKKVQPAAQAPTISAPVSAPPQTEQKPAAPVTTPEKPPTPQLEVTKPKPRPKPVAKKPSPIKPAPDATKTSSEPTTVAKANPPRIVVQPGTGTPETAATVVPGMSHTEESHHRQTTEQLMQSTEANIKSLKRVLNADERSLLQQVQLFMSQSREASEAQDLVKAHNLALKAHLLSDELIK
ncbi:MAG TPA: hypothetical protein VM009_03930 [Terriglobales bacterium]|nr:hypothetical protein [Terriglobales bacterium]